MDRKKKKRRRPKETDAAGAGESSYVCPTCGEEIVVPLDSSGGSEQTYVEDCPVCCHPNVIHVEFDPAWDLPRIWAESE